jgi:hypothetical protein
LSKKRRAITLLFHFIRQLFPVPAPAKNRWTHQWHINAVLIKVTPVQAKEFISKLAIMKIFETAYAEVTHYPENKLLVLIWNGSPTKEEYKLPFLAMIDFGKKTPVDSMLSDISNQGVVSPESRKWFEKEMMPQAVAAGLKRAAIVTNGNAFKMYYINIILSAVNKFPITTKLFNKRTEALEWLKGSSVKVPSV